MHENAQYVAGITHNPATLKLISNVSRKACPDIRLTDSLQYVNDIDVIAAIHNSATRIIPNLQEVFPYIENRYPVDMYSDDPGVAMPYDTVSNNPRTAMAFV